MSVCACVRVCVNVNVCVCECVMACSFFRHPSPCLKLTFLMWHFPVRVRILIQTPQKQHCWSVPSLNMDDIDIPDIELGNIPNLKVDEGLKLYDGAPVTC